LLEGAKRIGDLARTRWILAEMVRGNKNEDSGFDDAEITEEVMMHVFHAYAAYTVPFKRSSTVLVDKIEPSSTEPSDPKSESLRTSATGETLPHDEARDHVLVNQRIPSFSHLPPQSRFEVIGEVRTLFTRMTDDIRRAKSNHSAISIPLFAGVKPTTRLLNAYLSVHYAHGPFEDSSKLFKTIFSEHGISRNMRSYVEALERCSHARRGRERSAALEFAEELWAQWEDMENVDSNKARMVERANVAMIRILTL
jgi:hypothetical protein